MKRSAISGSTKSSCVESDNSLVEDDDDSLKDADYRNSESEDTSTDSIITPTQKKNKRFRAEKSLNVEHSLISHETTSRTSSMSSDSRNAADFKKHFDIQKSTITGSNLKNDKVGSCKLCHSKIKMKQSNTTGLKRHLKTHHNREYTKLFPCKEVSKSRTLTSMITSLKPMSQKTFEEKCVDWMAAKCLPFSFFDDGSTQEFFGLIIDKTLSVPKRTSLKTKTMERFTVYKSALAIVLQENTSKFSFTLDGWTSIGNKSYYGITIHYIDDLWKLRSFAIDFVPSRGLHSGQDIANMFFDFAKENNIESRIQGITLDNAASNTTFTLELAKMLAEKNIIFDEDNHFYCFAHIINLGVQDILKLLNINPSSELQRNEELYDDEDVQAEELVEEEEIRDNASPVIKIRSIFIKLKRSEQWQIKLKSCCEVVNLKFLSPIIDCSTRWNSTFDMLNTAVKMKEALNALCRNNISLRKLQLNEDEWKLILNVTTYLKYFKSLTVILSGDKYVTLPIVIIGFNMLLDKIEYLISALDNKENRDLVDENLLLAFQAGRDKLLKHYRKTNWNYCTALIFDPRHKVETFSLTSWGQQLQTEAIQKFEEIYKNFYYKDHSNENQQLSANSAQDDSDSEDLDSFNLTALFNKPTDTINNWRTEIDDYIAMPRANENTDILVWWENHQVLYPNLARMARDFLAIQATSVAAERMFSKAGLIIRKHRNRLDSESARVLLCLNAWQSCDFIKSHLK